jgi:hypothetical protein
MANFRILEMQIPELFYSGIIFLQTNKGNFENYNYIFQPEL